MVNILDDTEEKQGETKPKFIKSITIASMFFAYFACQSMLLTYLV